MSYIDDRSFRTPSRKDTESAEGSDSDERVPFYPPAEKVEIGTAVELANYAIMVAEKPGRIAHAWAMAGSTVTGLRLRLDQLYQLCVQADQIMRRHGARITKQVPGEEHLLNLLRILQNANLVCDSMIEPDNITNSQAPKYTNLLETGNNILREVLECIEDALYD